MAYSLLALGDSYTIGEGVSPQDSWPYQAVQLLQDAGQSFQPPEILARTGRTTDELAGAITEQLAGAMAAKDAAGQGWREPPYDFVTLLIGVNNQYRGRDVAEYAGEFESLLQGAIRLSGHSGAASPASPPRHVIVLSVPDWSISPFAHTYLPDAKGRTSADIASAIDAFNATAARISRLYGITFIDITTEGRTAGSDPALFTTDGLHPGAGTYRFWAERVAASILETLTAG
jgi:lysophospholipase L1-like esterase